MMLQSDERSFSSPVAEYWARHVGFSTAESRRPLLRILENLVAFCLFLVSPLLVRYFPGDKEVKLRIIAKNGQKIIPKRKDEFGLLAMTRKRQTVATTDKDEGKTDLMTSWRGRGSGERGNEEMKKMKMNHEEDLLYTRLFL